MSYLEEQSQESEHHAEGGNDRASSIEAVVVISSLDQLISVGKSVLIKECVGSVEVTTAQLLAIRGSAIECGVGIGLRARLKVTTSLEDGLVEVGAQTDLILVVGVEEAVEEIRLAFVSARN